MSEAGHGRNSEATRSRLIEAATEEFSTYGIAGARVDRLARQARANKAQIYHYFGSKEQLFDAVYAGMVDRVVAETPLDPTDLPGYAVALYGEAKDHPEVARLTAWYRLERADDHQLMSVVLASGHQKIALIEDAQRAGLVKCELPAVAIMLLISHVAVLWDTLSPEYDSLALTLSDEDRAEVIRKVVAAAVAT